jgi:hypothetical protein
VSKVQGVLDEDALAEMFGLQRPTQPEELRGRLCVTKPPFKNYIGVHGGAPDSAYARLDATFESQLIDARFYAVDETSQMPEEAGVYLVYHRLRLVYVGSTLRIRHRCDVQHAKSVREARRLDEGDVLFKAASCDDEIARLCIERRLIEWYEPEWNGLGFGRRPGVSNDRMDHSAWDKRFDRLLPIGGVRATVVKRED